MNYYSFHIGDYASHTRSLSLMEDLAYRRLLDVYYLAERPLGGTTSEIARLIGMREQLTEVEYVLQTFFELNESGCWCNKRADAEIERFNAKKQVAANAGRASAERRRNVRSTFVQRPFNASSTDVEKNPTDVQPTNNQEPRTKKPPVSPKGDEGFDRFWTTYPRKVAKPEAIKAWNRIAPSDDVIDAMLKALETQKRSRDWLKEDGAFIPHPSTWLNQRRWEDVGVDMAHADDPFAGVL